MFPTDNLLHKNTPINKTCKRMTFMDETINDFIKACGSIYTDLCDEEFIGGKYEKQAQSIKEKIRSMLNYLNNLYKNDTTDLDKLQSIIDSLKVIEKELNDIDYKPIHNAMVAYKKFSDSSENILFFAKRSNNAPEKWFNRKHKNTNDNEDSKKIIIPKKKKSEHDIIIDKINNNLNKKNEALGEIERIDEENDNDSEIFLNSIEEKQAVIKAAIFAMDTADQTTQRLEKIKKFVMACKEIYSRLCSEDFLKGQIEKVDLQNKDETGRIPKISMQSRDHIENVLASLRDIDKDPSKLTEIRYNIEKIMEETLPIIAGTEDEKKACKEFLETIPKKTDENFFNIVAESKNTVELVISNNRIQKEKTLSANAQIILTNRIIDDINQAEQKKKKLNEACNKLLLENLDADSFNSAIKEVFPGAKYGNLFKSPEDLASVQRLANILEEDKDIYVQQTQPTIEILKDRQSVLNEQLKSFQDEYEKPSNLRALKELDVADKACQDVLENFQLVRKSDVDEKTLKGNISSINSALKKAFPEENYGDLFQLPSSRKKGQPELVFLQDLATLVNNNNSDETQAQQAKRLKKLHNFKGKCNTRREDAIKKAGEWIKEVKDIAEIYRSSAMGSAKDVAAKAQTVLPNAA